MCPTKPIQDAVPSSTQTVYKLKSPVTVVLSFPKEYPSLEHTAMTTQELSTMYISPLYLFFPIPGSPSHHCLHSTGILLDRDYKGQNFNHTMRDRIYNPRSYGLVRCLARDDGGKCRAGQGS
ncbi:predicted protein [Plenodomus lingam JN3]|uniref:Predicted protein n=1 Tax=Leptosphaeria maculans (strain JN3 / isolate v23.1.3 / race Av1-4-5-6-7-8) TaxID=985895 RepID=E5R4C0_LEPMJ|nr:predicted protein [Plenodomus lingam JN3]CBX91888.1 predicted protein [Plenodomus lingam JN3]